MSYDALLEQTELLVSTLLLHCYEHLDAPSVAYGKRAPRAEPPAVQEKPQPQKPAVVNVKVPPKKQAPAVAVAATVVESKKPQQQPLPAASSACAPYIQTLSKALPKPEQPHFSDLIAKIAQFSGIPICQELPSDTCVEESLTWKKEYPQCAIVSFFAKGSQEEAFLQKVSQAIASRLGIGAALFSAPSQETAASLACYASSGILKAICVACDLPHQHKVHEWFSLFPSLEEASEQQEMHPLVLKKRLFSTPLYQLTLPPDFEQAVDFKTALWKALRDTL
ncbi:MAG: hypothetical protein JSR46_12185 [Verrucomicrobia bacterium]|nr:hypothetical protein [Verrucomicrobiota bacterium]